jgi:hypothetical protein
MELISPGFLSVVYQLRPISKVVIGLARKVTVGSAKTVANVSQLEGLLESKIWFQNFSPYFGVRNE